LKEFFKPLVLCVVLAFFLGTGCDIFQEKKAEIVLDGDLIESYTSYGSPQFEGYVKNVGDLTAYNVKVEIRCYSDSTKTNIIDTADGFPADLGNIDPGQRAYFDAVCFNLDSHDQIRAYDYEITWLDRDNSII
jgi:hypothetical protein